MKPLHHALVVTLVAACGTDSTTPPQPEATASVGMLPTTGQTVTGQGTFTSIDGDVTLTITLANAEPGVHGMHIHQTPDCSMDGMAAGGHWDGAATSGDPANHGLPEGSLHHVGDLGNVTIAADGTGTLERANEAWVIGDGSATDVAGHAIIFHALTDDGSMPSAGARAGCGIIVPDQP